MALPGSNKNDADLVRLIADGRIFLADLTAPQPTGLNWTPTSEWADIGYYSEDGFELTPNPGDSTEMAAHNGDTVVEDQKDGNWGLKFAGIQHGAPITEAYFETEVDTATGHYKVTKASASKLRQVVTVGMSADGKVILAHYPRVKVSDREAVVFNRTTLNALGLTFRTFKDQTLVAHFQVWDESLIGIPVPTITSALPSGAAAGATVTIVGTGFTGATQVQFGATNATSFTVVSDTEITAVMPAGTAGSAQVKVTTPGGVATIAYTRGA